MISPIKQHGKHRFVSQNTQQVGLDEWNSEKSHWVIFSERSVDVNWRAFVHSINSETDQEGTTSPSLPLLSLSYYLISFLFLTLSYYLFLSFSLSHFLSLPFSLSLPLFYYIVEVCHSYGVWLQVIPRRSH